MLGKLTFSLPEVRGKREKHTAMQRNKHFGWSQVSTILIACPGRFLHDEMLNPQMEIPPPHFSHPVPFIFVA